jgi:methionyl-tRNA synthetase
MTRRTLIALEPAIPSADLAIDRLAGTYLGADIYKRCLAQSGTRAHCVLTMEDHSGHVDLTARRLQMDPDRLVSEAREAIGASLHTYSIDIDRIGARGATYTAFARTFFSNLVTAGLLDVRSVDVLYDTETGAYPSDASLRGGCPTCLELTCGSVCEACGHPNAAIDLLGLDPHRYALRREPRLILDLERFRPELEAKLGSLSAQQPVLARLIQSVLARPLAPVVLSTRASRGISAGFAGLSDQRLHPTAESYAAQLHVFERTVGALSSGDETLQFTSFGTAFRVAFVHVALAAAAARCDGAAPGLRALVTSRSPLTGTRASSRTPIWARDLTDVFESDAVRLYLASAGPDLHEACFVRSALEGGIARVTTAIERLIARWNEQRALQELTPPCAAPRDLVRVMQAPLTLEDFMTAEPAQRALRGLEYFWHRLDRPRSGLTRYVPSLLALTLEPLCPRYVAALRLRFPEASMRWNEFTPCARQHDLPRFELRSSEPGVAAMSLVGVESSSKVGVDSHHEAIVCP